MHPVTTQAIAAERIREFHAHAAATERTRRLRSSRRAGRVWLFMGVLRSRPAPAPLPVHPGLRGPRAA
jgi:hypothetical protein